MLAPCRAGPTLQLLHLLFLALFLTPTTSTSPLPIPTPAAEQKTPCHNHQPGLLPRPANFSLYVLALQWPYTVCATSLHRASTSCRTPPAAFTVRGLWPTCMKPDSSPRCCGSPFALAPILDFAPALRRFWPDLDDGDDAALWRRQWDLHGSCSGLALRSYFRKVLDLARRYDFLRALTAHGVVASVEKDHDYETVQRALDEATGGFSVKMRCVDGKGEGQKLLDAVQVCLHRTRFETVHCPKGCLDGEVGCCLKTDRIRIPYWRRKHYSSSNNETWTNAANQEDAGGFWVGQIAGVFVLGGGLAYWLFMQFGRRADSRGRTNRSDYQRITGVG